jgi:Uma2 family endonuclease
MTALITDPELEQELIARRQATGADKYDEVWAGVYVMAPLANDEHQYLVKELTIILGLAVDWAGLGQTRPGVNISDRKATWKENYRCPDVAVFLEGTEAENCGAFWFGGPDFGVEIVSEGDRTLEKLSFYAQVRARELLIIDRAPWQLTLFRLSGSQMAEVNRSSMDTSIVLASEVLPLQWQLIRHEGRPAIRITHRDGEHTWLVKIPGE